MKITITQYKNGEVHEVVPFSRYHGRTEKEIEDRVKQCNDEAGYTRYVIAEIPDELCEAFKFLLGEDGYKKAHTILGLYDRLDNLESTLDSLDTDLYSIKDEVTEIKRRVEKMQ